LHGSGERRSAPHGARDAYQSARDGAVAAGAPDGVEWRVDSLHVDVDVQLRCAVAPPRYPVGMRVHHIALHTRQLAEVEHFYGEVLNLPMVRRHDGSAWLDMNGVLLIIEHSVPVEPER